MNRSGRCLVVAVALSALAALSCGNEEERGVTEGVSGAQSAAREPETCASIAGEIATIDGKIDSPAWAGLRADLLAAKEVLVKKATAHGCEATDL